MMQTESRRSGAASEWENLQKKISFVGRGINIGNSLDAAGGETAWGNPPITREMFAAVARKGFDTVRIPVSWGEFIGPAPGYQVLPARMERVREVVGWALGEELNVILNTHHENAWLHPDLETLPETLPKFTALWRQIALAFADCGEKLIFQGMNEPRVEGGENERAGGTPEVWCAINALNHAFVHTVRQCGGNNAGRFLCIPTYCARPQPLLLRNLIVPKDGRVVLTVHLYLAHDFACQGRNGTDRFCMNGEDAKEIGRTFDTLKREVQKLGVPVMITEYGTVSKILPDGTRNDPQRAEYCRRFLKKADSLNIPCVVWDNNYFADGRDEFGLLNRKTLQWNCPQVADAIVERT
jgi:endoglucanase